MLLEKLVALFVSTVCLVISAELLSSTKNFQTTVTRQTELHRSHVKLTAIFSETLQNLDNHRLPLLPRVQRGNKLTFSNAVTIPLNYDNPTIAPHPESDIFTTIRFDTKQRHLLPHLQALCMFPRDLHALVYSGESFFEVRREENEDPLCQNPILNVPRNSILFSQPSEEEVLFPALLIPIDSLYSVYTSKALVLRLVQHRGETIIENQPIRNNAALYELSPSLTNGIYHLELTSRTEEGSKTLRNELNSILSRYSAETVLFHSLQEIAR